MSSWARCSTFAWIDERHGRPSVIGDILLLDGLANDPVGVESDVYTLELTYDEARRPR
jgi:hypothetical protein